MGSPVTLEDVESMDLGQLPASDDTAVQRVKGSELAPSAAFGLLELALELRTSNLKCFLFFLSRMGILKKLRLMKKLGLMICAPTYFMRIEVNSLEL